MPNPSPSDSAALNIVVVGTGYVGLVTGACFAECGHSVVCVDSDERKLATLEAGKVPFYEPGLKELVDRHRATGQLKFTATVRQALVYEGRRAEAVFIAVGTPPRPDGSADLSNVETVAREIAAHLTGPTLVVDKSTVPVKTGEWVARTLQRYNRSGHPCEVASNPEFLAEGSAVQDFLHPDRIVIGVNSLNAEVLLRKIYQPIQAPVLVTNIETAELIKHACNSFLATKISFINAVSRLCEKVGADVTLVAQGMGMDRRIGPSFLKAGIGFGGFCFPKDLEAFRWISKQLGYDFELLTAVKNINDQQKAWVVEKLEKELWNIEGKRVAVWGLSFKPQTDDLRFAPSLEIIDRLLERKMEVRVYDPVAMGKAESLKGRVTFAKDPYEAAQGADAAVLVTEWPQFKDLDCSRLKEEMRHPFLLDGRNFYEPTPWCAAGFHYVGVGRSQQLSSTSKDCNPCAS